VNVSEPLMTSREGDPRRWDGLAGPQGLAVEERRVPAGG
jgi:hypothetical protein